jgi:hypothetical protein
MIKKFNSCVYLMMVTFFSISCQSSRHLLEQKKGTQQIEFSGSITPAIQFKTDESHYLFEGHIQNRGAKNIYQIESVIYLTDGGKKIQENGPIMLYEKEVPLKPGYEASFNKILELPISSWKGNTFILEITKTETEPPKKAKDSQK